MCVAAAAAGWIDPLAAAVLMPLSSAALALSSVAQGTFRGARGGEVARALEVMPGGPGRVEVVS